MKALLYSFAFFFLSLNSVFAQQASCGHDAVNELMEEMHPHFADEVEAWRKNIPKLAQPSASSRDGSIHTIPVVVHVIHSGAEVGEDTNIATSKILSQLEVMNEDYRRMNADVTNTPNLFSDIAADSEIEFCLASVDPDGNPTNGITRNLHVFVPNINYIEQNIKQETYWDTERYLNIWTVNMPDQNIIGYSFLPIPSILGGHQDGIVVDYERFGFINNNNRGRTLTHELGHYLGLQHVWGVTTGLSCNTDDGIDDTPNSMQPYYGCPSLGVSSCGSNDMFMNYMDYVDDSCMNLFTEGQKNVMRNTLTNLRSSLISNAATVCNNVVSNNEIEDLTLLDIYPNPVQNNVHVDINFEQQQDDLTINIFDARGALVTTSSYKKTSAIRYDFDFSAQAKGVYFVQITTAYASMSRKIVVR